MRDGHQVVDEVGRPDRSRTSEIDNDDDRGATLATIKLRQHNYNNSSLSTDDDQMRPAKINTMRISSGSIYECLWRSFIHVLTVVKVLFFSIASFWGTCQISTWISVASSLG
jgi:hypothetical protein